MKRSAKLNHEIHGYTVAVFFVALILAAVVLVGCGQAVNFDIQTCSLGNNTIGVQTNTGCIPVGSQR